jgi:hypothetical protein
VTTLTQLSESQADKATQVNELLEALSCAGYAGVNRETTTGLTWGYYGGLWGGATVADGELSLTGSSTCYIVVLRSSGAVSFSTGTTNWNDRANYARDYKVTTSAGAITAIEDHRAGPYGVFGLMPANDMMLAWSVGSSALTIALQRTGSVDADAANPLLVRMRSATAGSADGAWRSVAGALSLVVSSGSTLGKIDADPSGIYAYLIDNAGTLELAVCSSFRGWQGIVTTTAEGGAGAADAPTTMYSTTARTDVPFLCIGRAFAPQTTAGTWAAVPTSAEMAPFDPAEYATCAVTLTCTTGTITLDAAYDTLAVSRNGRRVHVQGRLLVDSVSSPTGVLTLNGLLFAASADAATGSAAAGVATLVMEATAATQIQARVGYASNTIRFQHFAAGAAGAMAADIKAGSDIYLVADYFTD